LSDNQENTSLFTHEIELISRLTPSPVKMRQQPADDDESTIPAAICTPPHEPPTNFTTVQQQQQQPPAEEQHYVGGTKVYLVPISRSKLNALSSSLCHHHNQQQQQQTVYITTNGVTSSPSLTTTTAETDKRSDSSSSSNAVTLLEGATTVSVGGGKTRPFTEDFLPLQGLFPEVSSGGMKIAGGQARLMGKDRVDWAYVDLEAFIEESCTLLRIYENLGQASGRRRKIVAKAERGAARI